MGDVVIKVRGITKTYQLYDAPIDRVKEAVHPLRKKYSRDFYALKNVNFEVHRGEAVGIIGRNGSGKSTLLKILTGVLTQTSGSYEVKGRIASILELGAGFNPELTGRENIYFYCTIIGLNKRSIEKLEVGIIHFADIGEFIDQPIKTYSSGMLVRLAFAVAVSIKPDILMIDEALAVGDLKFQLKCLRKIQEFKSRGVTIVFVSHDLGVNLNYCDKSLWLDDGQVRGFGAPDVVCADYSSFMAYDIVAQSETSEVIVDPSLEDENSAVDDSKQCMSFGIRDATIQKVSLCVVGQTNFCEILNGGENVVLKMEINVRKTLSSPIVGFFFCDSHGNNIFGTNTFLKGKKLDKFKRDRVHTIDFQFEFPYLQNGKYALTIAVADGTQVDHTQHHWIHDVLVVTVSNPSLEARYGSLFLPQRIDITTY